MKIAYVLNSYPMTSTTFIRREIEALEEAGLPIHRYAVRRWGETLVDALDIAEQGRTHYLMSGNLRRLVAAPFVQAFTNPAGLLRACLVWLRLCAERRELSPRLMAYLFQACYLRIQTKQEAITHVHSHFATNATAVAMLCHAMGGPTYSFTSHGPDEFADAKGISLALKVKRASFVVAISNFCRVQLALAAGVASWDRIVIARCGLKLVDFVPRYTFDADNQGFVCVGRLCPQKGQWLIPQAVAALKKEFPRIKVHFVGDGELREELEKRIAQHGVADHTVMHGWQSNAAIRELIANNRALILPSFAEGLPIVIMEALALGRPALSTYIAGIPELLDEDCGWIIPAGSEEALVEAMRAALTASPAELAAMARCGRKRVEASHDLQNIAADLRRCFEQAHRHTSDGEVGLIRSPD